MHVNKGVFCYIHLDIWRIIAVSSNENAYYFVDFIDNFFQIVEITYGKLEERKMKYFRSDNGLDSKGCWISIVLQNRR
jgi:hypothetical protein